MVRQRPQFEGAFALINVALAFLAVVLFAASAQLPLFVAGHLTSPVGTAITSHAAKLSLLLNGLAISVMAVTTYETFQYIAHKFMERWFLYKDVNAFFGDDAADKRGLIILQSDPIEEVTKDFVHPDEQDEEQRRKKFEAELEKKPHNRLFKARTWINRWDARAAEVIQRQFQRRLRLDPPRVLSMAHKPKSTDRDSNDGSADIMAEAPFVISLGLGFTEETTEFVKLFEPWLRIHEYTSSGDGVSLHVSAFGGGGFEEIAKGPLRNHFTITRDPIPKNDGFIRLLPRDWNLERWVHEPSTCWDYAMILRHTEIKKHGRRQVHFVLAGFTERGTAVAGEYLAHKWETLCEEEPSRLWRWLFFWRGRRRYGDFLLLITGLSDPAKYDEWTIAPVALRPFGGITRKTLAIIPDPIPWEVTMQPPEASQVKERTQPLAG